MNSLPLPDEDDPLEELTSQAADEFMEQLDRGEEPDVEEFVGRHPQIADVLRRLLPALQAMRESDDKPRLSLAVAPTVAETDRPGRLGDFEIIREIGRGGMGVVYEAVQLSLGRRVALKVLPFAAMLDPHRLQRFQNEARAAACLHHGNIVPIFGVGADRGVHFYAMQYIEGRNLAVLIRDARRQMGLPASPDDPGKKEEEARKETERTEPTPTPGPCLVTSAAPGAPKTTADALLSTQRSVLPGTRFNTAARLALQAAEALHHAHQQGVVHRDVKPANVIVDATGRLWVTDFGLAQVQSDPRLTTTGNILGTIRYMSPEQASGDQPVDHRTDIFSLGATLYELLALEPAFGGRDRATVLRRVVQDDPKPLRRINPSIPADLETIVGKAMAKSPEERYATAQALADDLRRFLEDKPILARPPSIWEKAAKWSHRRRHLVTAALVALLLAVCGLTVATILISYQKAETQNALDRAKMEEAAKEEALVKAKQEQTAKDAALGAEAEQQQRAEEAAWKARQVLNEFTKISVEEIPDKPELRSVRRKMLETALGYYKDFIDEENDNPAAQAELSASRLRVANILNEMGQKEESLAMYEQVRRASEAPHIPGPLGHLIGPGLSVSSLLVQSAVQKDLKLSPDQITALTALTGAPSDRRDERQREFKNGFARIISGFSKMRDPREQHEPSETHEPNGMLRGPNDFDAKEKACFEVLHPDQAKRLRQIVWQKRGVHALADDDVAELLDLSRDQRDRIHKIEEDTCRTMFRPENMQHHDEFWKDVSNRLQGVLTEEQKAKWMDLIGEPFKNEIQFSSSDVPPYMTPPFPKPDGRR
ncbi:MAG TPA: protein kinase [Gemmataceae bacterium]|nr:protein kinase [Gemmataceae bacterium]